MTEKYILAEKDYMDGMKYKDIASKYDVSINTVKSWKTRHKWLKDGKKKGVHTKQKGVHTKTKEHGPVVESDNLTDKQRLFCIYFIKSFNPCYDPITKPNNLHAILYEVCNARC